MDKKIVYVLFDLTEFKSLPALVQDVIWNYSGIGDSFDIAEVPEFARIHFKENRTIKCYRVKVEPSRMQQLKKDLLLAGKRVPSLNLIVLNPRKT